jgi:hypothetical protein
VAVLRRLARVFDIPPTLFGLTEPVGTVTGEIPTVMDSLAGPDPREGGNDPVRRRELLVGLAAVPLLAPGPTRPGEYPSAGALVTSMEDLLLRRRLPAAGPAPARVLRFGLAAAKADFQACRYRALADRLPGLVALAEAGEDTDALLAEVYNTVTHM